MAETKKKGTGNSKAKTTKKTEQESSEVVAVEKVSQKTDGNQAPKNDILKNQEPKAILKELAQEGKAKGMLTYSEIEDAFEKIDITPEQIEKIYEVLEKLGIDVVAENMMIDDEDFDDVPLTEPDDIVETEETEIDISIPEGVSIDDPVRMYLKEIGKVPLLTS